MGSPNLKGCTDWILDSPRAPPSTARRSARDEDPPTGTRLPSPLDDLDDRAITRPESFADRGWSVGCIVNRDARVERVSIIDVDGRDDVSVLGIDALGDRRDV